MSWHSWKKTLRDGDILNIDITVILGGWYGDTSRMFYVGTPSIKAQRLTEVTYGCLMRGIEAAKPGNTLGDIGHAIQSYAESCRYSVVRDFYRPWAWSGISHSPDRSALWRTKKAEWR